MQKLHVSIISCFLTFTAGFASAGDVIFDHGFEGAGPLIIADIGSLGAPVDELMTHQVELLTGGPAQWSIASGPAGLTIGRFSGVLSWTPDSDDIGDHVVVVEATEIKSDPDTEEFTITVFQTGAPPIIDPIADQGVVADTLLSLPVPANDPDVGDVLTFSLDTAPAGMMINAGSGLLTWTPTVGDIGDHPVTVNVSDNIGLEDNANFMVSVFASNSPPVLTPVPDQGAFVGNLFNFMLDATDPDVDPLTYELTDRPPGMSINATTGLISWTPQQTAQGHTMVTALVSDGKGGFDSDTFLIIVDRNYAPVANDDAYTVERGDTLIVPAPGILENDTDVNLDPLTAQLNTDVSGGLLNLNSDGSFDYTPDNPVSPIGFDLKFGIPSPNGSPVSTPRIADVDNDGITDIVVRYSNLGTDSTLVVHRGDTGAMVYESPRYDRSVSRNVGTDILADIDLDGKLEMISVGAEGGRSVGQSGRKLVAMEHDGTFKWVSDPIPDQGIANDTQVNQIGFDSSELSVADLDQDGTPEIIFATGHGASDEAIGVVVYDNQGKHLFTRYARDNVPSIGTEASPEIVDLDLDGDPEILILSAAFSHTGEELWLRTDLNNNERRATPIAANLDNDPYPELVRSNGSSGTIALNHDGSTLWDVPTTFAFDTLGVLLVVADVDDDGRPEVLGANNSFGVGRFDVLNGIDGSLKWQYPPPEQTGLNFKFTAPTVLDVDRDGDTEVLLFTQDRVIHLLDGATGTLINTFDLAIDEASMVTFPMFVDVDQDGASELVLAGEGEFGAGNSTLSYVYEAPNDDWVPTGSIWNQQNFHVTNINPDGTVPQFERPHWLIPGLDQNRINGLLPEERVASTDSFTYQADDGELLSNIAQVSFEILPPNNPPRILSEPRTLASPDFLYEYPMLVVDADVGEILTYNLIDGPASMSLSGSGVLTWTPTAGDLGVHPVILQVVDSIGLEDTQIFEVTVQPPSVVPNVIGLAEATAVSNIEAVDLVASPIIEVFSDTVPIGDVVDQDPLGGGTVAAGTPIGIDVSMGPAPVFVPRVVSLDLDEGLSRIAGAGLAAGTRTWVNNSDLPVGGILQQTPPPDSQAIPGTLVDLVISGGPRLVVEVNPSIIIPGTSASIDVTVFDNEGVPEDPQPPVDLAIEFDPVAVSGPVPTISVNDILTDPAAMGEYQLRATITGMSDTDVETFITLPEIADDEFGDIYTEFSMQLDEYSDLIDQLQAAIDANNLPLIASLDTQLMALRDSIDVAVLKGMNPMVAEEDVPPDPDTAMGMGFMPGAEDDAYIDAAMAMAQTMSDTRVLLADISSPDVFVQVLTQDLIEQANALDALEPSVHGTLSSAGVVVDLISSQVPSLIVSDINAIHEALADAGLVTRSGGRTSQVPNFSIFSMMSAVRIRNNVIKRVYKPLLGDLLRAFIILGVQDALVTYANAGNMFGIITGASQSIHVFKIKGSVAEGIGFEGYAQANSTIMIPPDKIADAQGILSAIPNAKSFKDINKIKGNITKLAGSIFSQPDGLSSGCILDPSPACGQLVHDDGFEDVYRKTGPLSLPAPVLMVIHGAATGTMNVFVANFLPYEEEDD